MFHITCGKVEWIKKIKEIQNAIKAREEIFEGQGKIRKLLNT
jgi:hypothetical protein